MTFDPLYVIANITTDSLSLEEASVLATHLESYLDDGHIEGADAYTCIVNFLNQASRITLNQKHELLDLLG